MPVQESKLATATTSANTTLPAGSYDVAYDIWFNQTATTAGQPNGTEIMIWFNHAGFPQPFGSQTGTVTIDGATWAVWTGRQTSWNIISYVREPGVNSVSNLDLMPFFSDSVSRGSLQSSWWLIDIEMGFEVWTGGQGLALSNFSANVTAGTVVAAPSISSISPVTGAAGSSVTISGANFGASQGSSTVNFGGTHATVTSWSNNSIVATVPASLSTGPVGVTVTVGGSTSNSVNFTVSGGSGGGSSCHIGYTVTNQWSTGFQVALAIQNTGTTAISNWQLKWTFPGNQLIGQLWNGNVSQSGENVTVTNASYNGSIAPGATASGIGFTATYSGANSNPASFTLNGAACK
jgi:hypothetical protein